MPHRAFALLFLVSAVLSGCEAAAPAPEPVARAYAAAWSRGDHAAMFELLTEDARAKYGDAGFLRRLPLIAQEMSLATLTSTAGAAVYATGSDGKRDQTRATVPLVTRFETTRVGEFTRETALALVLVGEKADARWLIDWSPTAVLPTLTPGRLVRMTRVATSRGRIVARDDTELATFVESTVVGVVPGQVKSESGMLASLSTVIGMPADEIRARYTQAWVRPDTFVPIRTLAPDAAAAARPRLTVIEGVQLRPQRVRSYPTGLAAQTIGYVGEATEADATKKAARGVSAGDVVGKTGLEAALDDELGGRYGWRLSVVEPNEQPVELIAETLPLPGQDVRLSLDPAMQRAAEAALGDERGSIVAEDPASGEILAIASRPSYDPNIFVSGDAAAIRAVNANTRRPLFNRATFGQYATGSSFKMVTAAAALREGLYRAGDRLDCPSRWTGYGPQWTQLNHETGDLGPIDLRVALARSCNTFFYELGKRLNDRGPDLLPNTAKSFGLGKATDIDFVFEEAGIVPSPAWKQQKFTDAASRTWNPGDATNLAIGQGFLLATPLQMANYAAAIANDGLVWKPRLVLELRDRSGAVTKKFDKAEAGRAASKPADLSLIRDGMRAVVDDPQGTVHFPFRGFAVAVAGKSGTAETTAGDPNAWFVGFAPFDAPTVAIATVFEEKAGLFGSQDAARATRAVLAAKFGTP